MAGFGAQRKLTLESAASAFPLSGHLAGGTWTAQSGGFETLACKSGALAFPDDDQIGTSVARAAALDDVECGDRTAKTL